MIANRSTWFARVVALCAVLVISAIGSSASATILLTEVVSPNRTGFTGTIGFRFVPNKPLSVTALGFQDANDNGLATSHQVGIWNATTSALIVSATIQSGTGSTLVSDWRYEPITPIYLTAGQQYFLAGFVGSSDGDSWTDAHPSAGVSSSADAAITQDAYRNGSFGVLNADGGGNNLRWGPANMQYEVIPEPSTYALGLIGLLGLGLLAWRRKRGTWK